MRSVSTISIRAADAAESHMTLVGPRRREEYEEVFEAHGGAALLKRVSNIRRRVYAMEIK